MADVAVIKPSDRLPVWATDPALRRGEIDRLVDNWVLKLSTTSRKAMSAYDLEKLVASVEGLFILLEEQIK